MNGQLYVKRKENKLTQEEVGKRLSLTKQGYHLKESGKSVFTIPEGVMLARLFECSLDDLFGKELN